MAATVIYLDHADPSLLEGNIPAAVPSSLSARTELPVKKACIMTAWGQAEAGQENATGPAGCDSYQFFQDAESAQGRVSLAEGESGTSRQ